MAYPLSASAQAWQAKARVFVDEELIPFEGTAEFNEGELPSEVYARHQQMALGLGLPRIDAPLAYGGLALLMLDRGEDVALVHTHCSMVKLYASEMANRVADRVVQIFGGRGYMRSNAAQRFFRELRVDRIWEGTSEIQRLIIARTVLKRGVEGVIGR